MSFEPTPEQRTAIESVEGDLFISAGAGSGKTAVLARRFARGVECGAAVDEILAITFTHKAAGEIAERVRRVLRHEAKRPDEALAVQGAWISTIHGFCSRILRRHAIEAGIAPGFRVLDAAEAGLVEEQAFEEAIVALWGDGEIRELLARFGANALRAAVLRLHGRLRSLGASAEDLPEMALEPLDARITEALCAVDAALGVHGAAPKNATQAHNAAELRSLFAKLTSLRGVSSEERAAAALGIADSCDLRLRCPSTKEMVRAAREAVIAVGDAVLDAEAASHARTLRRLLGLFTRSYALRKRADGVLDQDDLQEATERLFRARPELAEAYARKFRMIMVDEFQDTNELQVGVVGPLCRNDLCVVGDERQAIYSFRDAEVEVFRRLREGIEQRISLHVNFRSHPGILSFVNALFGADALFGSGHDALAPGLHFSEDEEVAAAELLVVERKGWPENRWRAAEARELAERLRDLVDRGEAEPGDIVVLLRAFRHADVYLDALETVGLPAVASAGGGFAARPEIMEIEALLAVAAMPHDEDSLATVLLGRLAGIDVDTLLDLQQHREMTHTLWDALCALDGFSDGSRGGRERLVSVRRAVEALRDGYHRRGLADALVEACETLGVRERLLGDGPGGERAWANVRKLVRMAESFGTEESQDPAAFVEWIRAIRRLGDLRQASPVSEGAVRLMTIHGAKGLEFPVVAVADLGRKLLSPNDMLFVQSDPERGVRWSLCMPESPLGARGHRPRAWQRMCEEESERQVAEEKRLLYVACTRAERRLILSGATRLDEAEDGTPMTWIRDALGLSAGIGDPGVRTTGDARWELRTVRPAEEGDEPGTDSAEPPLRAEAPETHRPHEATPAEAIADRAIGSLAFEKRSHEAPASLSYTALEALRHCGQRFYAERVLGLTRAASGDRGAVDLGNALHAALQSLATARDARGGIPTPLADERIRAIARGHGLTAEGGTRLAEAVESFSASAIAKRAWSGERVAAEVPFAIPLVGTRLVGAMDLVSWSGDEALVIDYKTGSPSGGTSRRRRDGEGEALSDRYRLQAECYALALLQSGVRRVDVAFVAVEQDAETSTLAFTAEDAAGLREKLEGMARRACQGPYEPLDRYDHETCRHCPVLGGLCAITPPARSAGGAA